jgi:hypothetical protein
VNDMGAFLSSFLANIFFRSHSLTFSVHSLSFHILLTPSYISCLVPLVLSSQDRQELVGGEVGREWVHPHAAQREELHWAVRPGDRCLLRHALKCIHQVHTITFINHRVFNVRMIRELE